jgi:two-component system response regulator YesN
VVLEPYFSALPRAWTFLAAILRFRESKTSPNWVEVQEAVRKHGLRMLGAVDVLIARLDHASYVGVLVFSGEPEDVENRVRARTERVIRLLASRRSGPILQVGIGCARRRFREVVDSYQEATAVMDALRWESGSSAQCYSAATRYLFDPKLHQEYVSLRHRLIACIRTRQTDGARAAFEELVRLVSSDGAAGSPNRTMMLGQLARDLTLENIAAHSGVVSARNSLLELSRIRGYGRLLEWMRSLIVDTAECLERRSTDRHADLAQRVMDYVQEHYAEPVVLQTIEDRFGVTASHFGKVFREQTGTTFHKYLTNVRLERAMSLLKGTDYPLRVVADECGFDNRQNLIRVFRQLRGMTPTEFRRAQNGFAS